MYTVASFAAGLVFGLGLLVSGMANPAKVLGFLDIAGAWDPSLALVMAGAVAVGAGAFALMRKRTRTLLGAPVLLPSARRIDRRVIFGSLVFGVGWGLGGIWPGTPLGLGGKGSANGLALLCAHVTRHQVVGILLQEKRRALC